MTETRIQVLDKKDSKIIRNAIRYVLTVDMGIDEVSLKNITSPIIEERLNKKIDAILNTALDKINRKIEESIEKRLRQSALSNLMYSFEKDVLKPVIGDFVKNVEVSLDYKNKLQSVNSEEEPRTTQRIYPVKVVGNDIAGFSLELIDFNFHVTDDSFNLALEQIRDFLLFKRQEESSDPLPKPSKIHSSKLFNVIYVGV